MDPNITGSPGAPLFEGFSAPPIQRIVVLGLTAETQSNATGIGPADVTTIRCVHRIDWGVTYTNCVTATIAESAKMRMILITMAKPSSLRCGVRPSFIADRENRPDQEYARSHESGSLRTLPAGFGEYEWR